MTAALPTPEVAQRAPFEPDIAQVVLKKNVFETQEIDIAVFTRHFFAVDESKPEFGSIGLRRRRRRRRRRESLMIR